MDRQDVWRARRGPVPDGCRVPRRRALGTTATHSVLHYGDSLAVGTGLFLPHYLPRLDDPPVGRTSAVHADEGSRTLALRSTLPHVIVISLGTNDDPGAVTAFGTMCARR